jgi:hypothetical protein
MSQRRTRRPVTRYRVVVYQLDNGNQNVVMDSSGDGYIAATGTATPADHMTGDIGGAGPPDILEDLADLIAQEPFT